MGQAERDWQNKTARTGLQGKDSHDRYARTGLPEQGPVRIRQQGWDRKERTLGKEQAEHGKQKRTNIQDR
jgi:hypothetical protein